MIALVAFAMGVRNAIVRKLAVPDLTTTVLTLTLTGLAADAPVGQHARAHSARRVLAVAAMLGGASSAACSRSTVSLGRCWRRQLSRPLASARICSRASA